MLNKSFFVSLTLAISFISIPTISNASPYECYRAAKAGEWQKTRKPKGNWGPIHNTSKWSYSAVSGKDIYRHKNGKRTVGTRCKGVGYNYGQHKVDFEGKQDWCVKYIEGWSQSTVAPHCPQGYSLSANKKNCIRPAKAGKWNKTRKPKGNWGPIHNTSKWSYSAVSGKDIYRHKNGKRTVGTRCKGVGYNYGQHKVDFEGTQDWCANWSPSTPSNTILAQCPSNYTLTKHKFKKINSSVLKNISAVRPVISR